jgi:hypothetical protein
MPNFLGMQIIESKAFPGDSFAMFGAMRLHNGERQQHVCLYRNGQVTCQWMRLAQPTASQEKNDE